MQKKPSITKFQDSGGLCCLPPISLSHQLFRRDLYHPQYSLWSKSFSPCLDVCWQLEIFCFILNHQIMNKRIAEDEDAVQQRHDVSRWLAFFDLQYVIWFLISPAKRRGNSWTTRQQSEDINHEVVHNLVPRRRHTTNNYSSWQFITAK